MKTKLTSLILSAVLIVCALSTVFVVSAANNDNGSFVLSFNGPQQYLPDQTIVVTATVKDVTATDGLAALTFELDYDKTRMELIVDKKETGALDFEVTYPAATLWENMSTVKNGKVFVQLGNTRDKVTNVKNDGDLVIKFKFKIKDSAQGNLNVGAVIGTVKGYNGDMRLMSGSVSNLTILTDSGNHLRGDMNEDGRVSSNDAIYLLRYTLHIEYYPIYQSGDFDGNGTVNSNDAIYLLRHTLFPVYYPLN